MPEIINLYCDESCHLENDGLPIMGFGALRCPADHLTTVTQALAALKEKHRARGELKWEKVSPSRLAFYEELIDWFFADPQLRFRGWLVEHKERLAHDYFNAGSHDSFYYKMFYYLLEPLIRRPQPDQSERTYRVYLDVKDTRITWIAPASAGKSKRSGTGASHDPGKKRPPQNGGPTLSTVGG
jgi:hypothetical protein